MKKLSEQFQAEELEQIQAEMNQLGQIILGLANDAESITHHESESMFIKILHLRYKMVEQNQDKKYVIENLVSYYAK
ncbi:hypothetical protein L9W73_04905 [Vibrio aestuarianus]|uniref:Uncharacterized protein n=1 Tax=Vibrio aestuarianus TaxID=28171 RepID=A0A9X4FJP4_9VIBR|nr:hypothetical protein [Vibrio aestuarianus]MDE1356650.1 hypothetical protein [Vibrio aestuarianus]